MMHFRHEHLYSTLANSEDPDQMPDKVAFHLGLRCLQKYLFTERTNELLMHL